MTSLAKAAPHSATLNGGNQTKYKNYRFHYVFPFTLASHFASIITHKLSTTVAMQGGARARAQVPVVIEPSRI